MRGSSVERAEALLRARLGEPVKKPTKYFIGFATPTGRVLALHRTASAPRIWYQPPAAPALDGVVRMPDTAKNSNLNGPLKPLSADDTQRVELRDEAGLERFVDWYAGLGSGGEVGR